MSNDVVTVIRDEEATGAAVLNSPLAFAELKAGAAVDQSTKLDRFDIVVGAVAGGQFVGDEQFAEMKEAGELGENPIAPGDWAMRPAAEHRSGIWADNGLARLSETAEKKLCALAGAPRRFIRKYPRDYQVGMLNYAAKNFLKQGEQTLRLSTLSENCSEQDWRVRSILGKHYSPLDDAWVFQIVSDGLEHFPDAKLHEARIDDNASRLCIGFENVDLGDSAGRVGIVVSNSEVGLGALNFDAYIWKQVCSNGMVARCKDTSYSFRHYGQGKKDSVNIEGAMYDVLESARTNARMLRDGLEKPLKEPTDELRKIATSAELPQSTLDALVSTWAGNGSKHHVTGVVDALTAHAQSYEEPTARHELEVIAGKYLNGQFTEGAA